jgi:predicted ATPase with chaperone activity
MSKDFFVPADVQVTISRTAMSLTYPAQAMLVVAATPCGHDDC